MTYKIEITEDAKIDLSFFRPYERKIILMSIREQLLHEPLKETKDMKTINLEKEKVELSQVFNFAQTEPVLLMTEDGQEFILSQADNFNAEVEALQNSRSFQKFLDERMKCKVRIPIEEIEKDIEKELNSQSVEIKK